MASESTWYRCRNSRLEGRLPLDPLKDKYCCRRKALAGQMAPVQISISTPVRLTTRLLFLTLPALPRAVRRLTSHGSRAFSFGIEHWPRVLTMAIARTVSAAPIHAATARQRT